MSKAEKYYPKWARSMPDEFFKNDIGKLQRISVAFATDFSNSENKELRGLLQKVINSLENGGISNMEVGLHHKIKEHLNKEGK
tara:strand:- start:378 stop:626 length:249 start_codon:yes stop_codon:yes gene_type:complete